MTKSFVGVPKSGASHKLWRLFETTKAMLRRPHPSAQHATCHCKLQNYTSKHPQNKGPPNRHSSIPFKTTLKQDTQKDTVTPLEPTDRSILCLPGAPPTTRSAQRGSGCLESPRVVRPNSRKPLQTSTLFGRLTLTKLLIQPPMQKFNGNPIASKGPEPVTPKTGPDYSD